MKFVPDKVIKEHINDYGFPLGLKLWWRKFYLRKTTSHQGTNIFEQEWDAAIILDGCRVDAMREVASEYEYISSVETATSVGSATYEWMPATFENQTEPLEDLAYVSGNPFTQQFLDPDEFAVLDEVWKYAWDDSLGTVPPRPITDQAISTARENAEAELLVHYMQPHTPFITSEDSPKLTLENFDDRSGGIESDWTLVARGIRSKANVWEDYLDNLRTVLDDVGLLLENLDAEQVIITSDHGNAIGECGIYGHPGGVSIPQLYKVPWIEASASDTKSHDPPEYERAESKEVEDRLRALGYA